MLTMLRSEEPAEYSSYNNTAVGNKNDLVNLLNNELFKLFYIFSFCCLCLPLERKQ